MLEGKRIIITGAAQGIGAKTGLGLAAMGAKVCLADIASPDKAVQDVIDAGGSAIGVQMDVTSPDDCNRMAAETVNAFGAVDGLVCNAALFTALPLTPFDEIDIDEWDRVMAVNVKGPWLCTRAVVPHMTADTGGSIVMFSTNRISAGHPMMLHYDASKGAVHAMTRSLIRELGDRNIRVNTIMPGLTMSEGVLAREGIEDRAPLVSRGRSLKRDQTPEDIVGPTSFFLSEQSAFITGQSLIVDGGGQVG